MKRETLQNKNKRELEKLADKYFSKAVRLRDSIEDNDGVWRGNCITCDRPQEVYCDGHWARGVNSGHFIGRGNKVLRYDSENSNLQCVFCNKWRSGEHDKYRHSLDLKYGIGTAKKLEKQARENRIYSISKDEYIDVIETSKEEIRFYLGKLA